MINKIYNEDCLISLKIIPDNSIDLVVIDPPYDVCIKDCKKGKTKIAYHISNLEKELIDNNLTDAFDYKMLDELVRVMKKINIYIWCNGRQIPVYFKKFIDELNCKFDILIWNNTNPIPLYSNKYLSDKEYCWYFRKQGYCQPKSYDEAKTVYTSTSYIKDKMIYGHPTINPLDFIKKIIRNSRKEIDVILDCFLGSVTTVIACILENRNYIGYEINKKYYDIAIKRINSVGKNDKNGQCRNRRKIR